MGQHMRLAASGGTLDADDPVPACKDGAHRRLLARGEVARRQPLVEVAGDGKRPGIAAPGIKAAQDIALGLDRPVGRQHGDTPWRL